MLSSRRKVLFSATSRYNQSVPWLYAS